MGDRYPKRSDLIDQQGGIEEDLRQQEIADRPSSSGGSGYAAGLVTDSTVSTVTFRKSLFAAAGSSITFSSGQNFPGTSQRFLTLPRFDPGSSFFDDLAGSGLFYFSPTAEGIYLLSAFCQITSASPAEIEVDLEARITQDDSTNIDTMDVMLSPRRDGIHDMTLSGVAPLHANQLVVIRMQITAWNLPATSTDPVASLTVGITTTGAEDYNLGTRASWAKLSDAPGGTLFA